MHGFSLPDSVKPLQVRYADARKPSQQQTTQVSNEIKLFVGNLPLTSTQEMLAGLFAPYGNMIEAFLFPRGSATGKCGFVRYSTPVSAQAAINALNGQSLDGVTSLVVREADASKRQAAVTMQMANPLAAFAALRPAEASSQLSQLTQLSQQLGSLIRNLTGGQAPGPMKTQWPQMATGFKPY
jgi:RNA recognition motif-containing protein